MNCINCEIKRAKIITKIKLFMKKELDEIANGLSQEFGESYYVVKDSKGVRIERISKIPPYNPIVIYEGKLNE